MNRKDLIAHEFGHAMCSMVQDSKYTPIDISLKAEKDMLGWCDFNYEVYPRKLKTRYSKHKSMSDLGGLFGELVLNGKWMPFGARSDIDSYIIQNSESQKLATELDNWFFIDEDDLSFRACTKLPGKNRRFFFLDAGDTAERLPHLWEAYLEFCSFIDKEQFRLIVEEVYKNKLDYISASVLKRYVNETLREKV